MGECEVEFSIYKSPGHERLPRKDGYVAPHLICTYWLVAKAMEPVRMKSRVTFYYLMAEKVNQLDKFHD